MALNSARCVCGKVWEWTGCRLLLLLSGDAVIEDDGFRVISEGVSFRFNEKRCRSEDRLLISGGEGSCCMGAFSTCGDAGIGV